MRDCEASAGLVAHGSIRRPERPETWLLIAVLLAGTGCSWVLIQKAPSLPVEAAPPAACTSSDLAPVLDNMGALILILSGSG